MTPQRSTLELTADVVHQSSPEAPARVAATLTNTGSTTVKPGFGPTLLFSDSGPGEDLARPEPLVLDPESDGVPLSDPVQTDDGCWRFPEDGRKAVQSSLGYRELAPGDEIREEYNIYTAAEATSCLPEGSYRHQDNVELPDSSWMATLTLTLTTDESSQITVSGDASAWERQR